MTRKFLFFLLALVFGVGQAAAKLQDCPELVKRAVEWTQNVCATLPGDEACYGYRVLDAQLTSSMDAFQFNKVGDRTPVNVIDSIRLSALDPVNDRWGVLVMRLRADLPDTVRSQNVTLLAFGGVTLDTKPSGPYQPMQAFTFSSDPDSSTCSGMTDEGLLIQTPEGSAHVTLWINEVRIRMDSTTLFQAQPGGNLTVSSFEGSTQVEANGQTQEASAGTTVRVPMDQDLHPAAPQPFNRDALGLDSLLRLSAYFTNEQMSQPTPVASKNSANQQPIVDTIATLIAPPAVDVLPAQNPVTTPPPDSPANPTTVLPTNATDMPPQPLPTIEATVNQDVLIASTTTSPGNAVTSSPVTPEPIVTTAGVTTLSFTTTPPTPASQLIVTPAATSSPPIATAPPAPASQPIVTTAAPTEQPPLQRDCNSDHGKGSPDGNCYGHQKHG